MYSDETFTLVHTHDTSDGIESAHSHGLPFPQATPPLLELSQLRRLLFQLSATLGIGLFFLLRGKPSRNSFRFGLFGLLTHTLQPSQFRGHIPTLVQITGCTLE
jgi:hypothetical protein